MKNKFIDDELYNDIKSGTNIITGEEYKQLVYGVSQVACDMVIKTLGPSGKTTLLDDGTFSYPTKDGYNVLSRLRFNDPVCNTLFNTLRQISFTIVNKVGDGTTTALVGANAFLKLLLEYQQTHEFRQADFINKINEVKERIITELLTGKELKTIDAEGDFSDIYKIASISSNGNTLLASFIQKIYQETKNPNIYVTLDQGSSLSWEIQNGYKFDCKVLNHKAYVNEDDGTCKKTEPTYVAIFDHNVTYNEHAQVISMLSKFANAKQRELIIIAPYFDDIITNIIGTTINSFLQKNQIPNIMMIQVPLSMDIHRKYLSDIILLTNAQVFDYGKVRACNVLLHNQTCQPDEKIEDALLNIEQYKFDSPEELITACVGITTNLTIAEKYTIIKDYDVIANPDLLKQTLIEAEELYVSTKEKAHQSTTTLHKDYMDAYQRYTKLVGKMGVIKVGASSELEKHCMKDLVDDAVLACKSAYDNGYVKGLNLSLLRTINKITPNKQLTKADERNEKLKKLRELEIDICELFHKAFSEVSMSVLRNKYDDDMERMVYFNGLYLQSPQKMSNSTILQYCILSNFGYNLVEDTFEDEENCSVINSVSADIEILNAIVSILSLMLTSNQFLSVNRGYDRRISKKQAIDEDIKNKTNLTKEIVKGVLEELSDESKRGNDNVFKRIYNAILNK